MPQVRVLSLRPDMTKTNIRDYGVVLVIFVYIKGLLIFQVIKFVEIYVTAVSLYETMHLHKIRKWRYL